MSFNYSNLPLLRTIPKKNSGFAYYCELGQAPSFQFIVASGQVVNSIELTNGVDIEPIVYSLAYDNELTFRIVTAKKIAYTPTFFDNVYIKIITGSDIYYSPFIKFCEAEHLWTIEYSHHEPIVIPNGEHVGYNNGYKGYLYLPKSNKIPTIEKQDTTSEKDLIKFDTNKVIKKNYQFEVIGDEGMMDTLSFIGGHSYIKVDNENVIEFDADNIDAFETGSLFKTILKYSTSTIISTNVANGSLFSIPMDINPIPVNDYGNDGCENLMIADVFARLLFTDDVTTAKIIRDDAAFNNLTVSTSTKDGLTCKYAQNATALDIGRTYYYEINGIKSALFRAPMPLERLLKVKVQHSDIIFNGSKIMHFEDLNYLEGIYKFHENWNVLPEIETLEDVIEIDLVKHNFLTVKKKWYTTKIIIHPTALTFLEFANTNDNVVITIGDTVYDTWELEIGETELIEQNKMVVSLRWNIGEITRTRNAARALSIYGDYNEDYSDDYTNY